MLESQITITGFIVGTIWMPAAECWKELHYDLTREQQRVEGKRDFRWHVTQAAHDGDFQSCAIAQGELTITRRRAGHDGRVVTHSRTFPLDRFPSAADCLYDDPDWWPDYGDD
jgi:hypothetical protein